MTRVAACRVLLVFLAAAGLSCRSTPKASPGESLLSRFDYDADLGGAPLRMTVYAPDEATAEAAGNLAVGRAKAAYALTDARRADGELARVNAAAGGEPVRVGDGLFPLLALAVELARRSDGAFDPTAGPYLDLWDASLEAGRLPRGEELSQTAQVVGWNKLWVEPINRTAQLAEPGMRLDLSGLADGYAADAALAALRVQGVGRVLVEVGHTTVLGDPPPGRPGWTLEIRTAPPKGKGRFITVSNVGVSTAGAGEPVEYMGRRFGPLLNPLTGLGTTNGTAATVIAHTGTAADGLADAAAVLGAEKSQGLLRSVRAGAYFHPAFPSAPAQGNSQPSTAPTDSDPALGEVETPADSPHPAMP